MTLIELLVVIVIMAMSAALVYPALSSMSSERLVADADSSGGAQSAGNSVLRRDPVIDGLLTKARRTAIKRGEPLRLRVDRDGVWAIISVRDAREVEAGRASRPSPWLPDVVIDALGNCVLSPSVVAPPAAFAWDALACRWRSRT